MAQNDKKRSWYQHEHPLYEWIGLFFGIIVVLAVAGWYYLTYLDSLNADTESDVSSAYSINN